VNQILRRNVAMTILAGVLGGCAQTPWSPLVDVEPLNIPEIPEAQENGSIYQANRGGLALFEDRRPRDIGDVITIQFNESVSASKNASSNTTRDSNMSLSAGELTDALAVLGDYGFDLESGSSFSANGGAAANNKFTGTLTVQVHEIYPNGNLRVAGEKKIAINKGTEYIRFSGVVNPRNISGTNTVPSSEVANANIEYVGTGYLHEAQRMGWLQRLWINISPF
jgi:flagellar L-ring protein precursor FlgH